MKIEELRIGNLITDKWASEGSAFRIITLSAKYPIIKYGANFSANIEHVRPIPLTEEWLIKFGFEGDIQNGFGRDTVELGYITTDSNFQFEYAISHKRGCTWLLTDIKFVHQLQNLYFALTGNELTI